MNNSIQLTCIGGVGVVTGANFLLELGDTRLLVDCGLEQGEKEASADNRKPFEYDVASIDYLFVTHAHLDHVGRIGKLVKDGFRGQIYSTPETKAIAKLIMEDAVHLLDREARQEGLLPLYEQQDVDVAHSLWKTVPYHTKTDFEQGFSLFIKDAGHILGSSMFEFSYAGKKIVFTGDLGNTPTPLLRDTEVIDDADYLIMESVYGDRNHEPKSERRAKLKQIINDTIARGGTVVIPAFSVERTQVLLYEINRFVENKEIPSVPVFVDSPLATKVTDIYKANIELFNPAIQAQIKAGDDIFNFPKLSFTETGEASRAIDFVKTPKIIVAGSGMSAGGRVIHHESVYLPEEKNTIVLVGYQTPGTLGRKLVDGAKKVSISREEVKVRAHIETIFGYSSHKDSDNLVGFVENTAKTVKKVFVAMGEPKASLFLVQKLRDNLGVNALYPKQGEVYKL